MQREMHHKIHIFTFPRIAVSSIFFYNNIILYIIIIIHIFPTHTDVWKCENVNISIHLTFQLASQ